MPPAYTPPWRALHAPKRGHSQAEYEDAWAVDAAAGRFAVADGASEASYSGLWARLLAEAFVAARRPWDAPAWLEFPRRRWSAEVDGLELSWYAEMKREQGAFAALVGLSVRPPGPGEPGRWRALAVGDSCLIRVRAGRSPHAFPLGKSADFGNQPRLLGSRAGPAPEPILDRGSCRAGDRLYLMTDALAQWFLLRCENHQQPWEVLERVLGEPDEAFADWVEQCRDLDDLRNDDVTLLAVGPIPPPPKE